MPRVVIDKGWDKYATALSGVKLNTRTKAHLNRASKRIGLMAVKQVRAAIKGSGFEPNAPLTVAIKGSTKPLVDKGDLFQAITFEVVNATTVFVGVLQTDRFYNVALNLHEGVEIGVTHAMRQLFHFLWQASVGKIKASELSPRGQQLFERFKDWRPLKEETRAIVIPGRPFMEKAFEDTGLRLMVQLEWQKAINAALKEQAGKK